MPTYDYMCDKCEEIHEIFHSIMETDPRQCPKCGEAMRKLFGGSGGFLFRGAGTYHTDYKLLRGSGYKPDYKRTKGGVKL